MLRAFKYWLFDGPDEMLPEQLARLKAACADLPKPQRIEGMEWPERDEMKKACVHCYSDNDILALELQREAERKTQPRNVVAMKTRGSVR